MILFLCCLSTATQAKSLPGRIPAACDPVKVGRGVTLKFLSAPPEGKFNHVHYSAVSEWVNCLEFARTIGDKTLENSLIAAMDPMYGPKADKLPHMEHVDFSVFGAVPLEIFILNGDRRAYTMGMRYADHQWEAPDMDPATNKSPQMTREQQKALWEQGYSPQTRFWIDDMYMITFLQLQAFRATGREEYLVRAAKELAAYLERLQKENGLFHHAPKAPFYWGRGNGWVAAGMPMVLKYLPKDSEYYAPILDSYRKMMATLLELQRKDGLWGQLIDGPDSWSETSGSAMFTHAFLEGWKSGLLDRRYAKAARKAWIALCGKLTPDYELQDICVGTGARADRQWYLDRPRKTGDPHGQAAIMWVINSLISE